MIIPAGQLQNAIGIYLRFAYPSGEVPKAVQERADAIRALAANAAVSADLLEPMSCAKGTAYALRLGQPMYPHMKLVVEPAVCETAGPEVGLFFRVDSHDRHLHAAPGSPDAEWLSLVRASNKALTDQIECAWSAADIPTFKDYLRRQLAARKARG